MTEQKTFEASAESIAAAKQLRLFAFLAWFIAIAGEVFARLKLIHNETLTWMVKPKELRAQLVLSLY